MLAPHTLPLSDGGGTSSDAGIGFPVSPLSCPGMCLGSRPCSTRFQRLKRCFSGSVKVAGTVIRFAAPSVTGVPSSGHGVTWGRGDVQEGSKCQLSLHCLLELLPQNQKYCQTNWVLYQKKSSKLFLPSNVKNSKYPEAETWRSENIDGWSY